MRHLETITSLACAATLSLLLTGCAAETMLVPAAGANDVGYDAALTKVDGVQLRANGEAWPGLADVRSQVTPVRLSIYNTSKKPLKIRYDQLWLLDQDGTRYAALPPFRITGSVVANAYGVLHPAFTYAGFDVAPAYAEMYPDLDVTDYDFEPETEDDYYATWYPYWGSVEARLPTPTMLRRALPEGVVKPGGRLQGYVYFQHVPDTAGRVDLDMRLVDASNNKVMTTARIPFATR